MEDLDAVETRMQELLSCIKGAGNVQLMLTVESGEKREFALDTEVSYSGEVTAPENYTRRSDVVIADNGNADAPLTVQKTNPVYRGAFAVCAGAGSAEVKLAVTQAIAALTGLSSERIVVVECQS